MCIQGHWCFTFVQDTVTEVYHTQRNTFFTYGPTGKNPT